jgi:hypothetical protein
MLYTSKNVYESPNFPKLVAKPTHGVLEYLPMNEDTDGQLPGL